MKESAIPAKNLTRPMLVEGATRGTYDTLHPRTNRKYQPLPFGYLSTSTTPETHPSPVQTPLNRMASSGGRSTTMNPFAPAILASLTACSSPSPWDNKGL